MKGGARVKKTCKGFTLLEMTIVLVLISLLGVALIPSMKLVYRQEMRKAADILCADLMTIRKQATATNNTYTLVVDSTDTHQYTISPTLLNATNAGRASNHQDDISPNVEYTIRVKYEDDSEDVKDGVYYQNGRLVDTTGAAAREVKEAMIKVTYDGTSEYAEIIYDGFTGRYSITIKG